MQKPISFSNKLMALNIFQELVLATYNLHKHLKFFLLNMFVNLPNDLVFPFKKTFSPNFDIKKKNLLSFPCASLNSTLQVPKLFNFNFDTFFQIQKPLVSIPCTLKFSRTREFINTSFSNDHLHIEFNLLVNFSKTFNSLT
jgi:hypothetical protein